MNVKNNNNRTLRFLLVEDSPIIQRLVHELLTGQGHSVVFANGGKKAIEVLSKEKYDAVLMDLNIPEMNGFKTAKAIREKEKESGGRIPIIAITSLTVADIEKQCLDAGMDGYIPKPISKEKLLKKIEDIFNSNQ